MEIITKDELKAPSALGILAFLGGTAFFYFAPAVLMPILFATFVFILFDSTVSRLETWKIPRAISAPVLVLVALVMIYGAGYATYGNLSKMINQMPKYSQKIRSIVHGFEAKVNALQKNTETLLPQAPTPDDTQKVKVVQDANENWLSALAYGANSVFSVIADLLLIPLLAVFFLLEKKYLKARASELVRRDFPLDRVCEETAQMVKSYFWGNITVGIVCALGFFAVFMLLGLENPIALSLFAGFLNLIPIFGAFAGAVFPSLQALLQFEGYLVVVEILIASVVLHFLVNNIVIPKLVGSRINVNATAATLGFIFWGWLWGGVGLLVAIPLMAFLRIILCVNASTAPWGNLIAENPEFPSLRDWKFI